MRLTPLILCTACASAPTAKPVEPIAAPDPVTPPPEVTASLVTETQPPLDVGPVGTGELPWWHDLSANVYRYGGEVVVLAVGESSDHHHIAEGFLNSRISARIGVRRTAARIGFAGPMPEPELFDLFVTREHRFLALYRMQVPEGAEIRGEPEPLVPPRLSSEGPHRLGRHVFDGPRHLFLECDVEGPIANPDWGRSRASARP